MRGFSKLQRVRPFYVPKVRTKWGKASTIDDMDAEHAADASPVRSSACNPCGIINGHSNKLTGHAYRLLHHLHAWHMFTVSGVCGVCLQAVLQQQSSTRCIHEQLVEAGNSRD